MTEKPITTFIIPTIDRPTLRRAINSAANNGVPVLWKEDTERVGESKMRNDMIEQADTEWVSFLDDDDSVTHDYVNRLREEIALHPGADIIHFREYFIRTGQLLPSWPEVVFGNIGISFSIKREIALKYPFIEQPHEDLAFVQTIVDAGHAIHFSKYVTYHVRH